MDLGQNHFEREGREKEEREGKNMGDEAGSEKEGKMEKEVDKKGLYF